MYFALPKDTTVAIRYELHSHAEMSKAKKSAFISRPHYLQNSKSDHGLEDETATSPTILVKPTVHQFSPPPERNAKQSLFTREVCEKLHYKNVNIRRLRRTLEQGNTPPTEIDHLDVILDPSRATNQFHSRTIH